MLLSQGRIRVCAAPTGKKKAKGGGESGLMRGQIMGGGNQEGSKADRRGKEGGYGRDERVTASESSQNFARQV